MGGEWREEKVIELQNKGVLLVEDGNHGEYRPRPDEFADTGRVFVRAADMDNGRILFETASRIGTVAFNRIRKGIGADGDILLSHKGTVGKIAFVPLGSLPFVCSPQTTFWRVLDDNVINRTYLYVYMRSNHFHSQLRGRKSETDMADYVSLTAQRDLNILLPPLPEQRAIAHILGALDDKIELNRWMNATLEGMARAIFRAWFVEFLPVKAKAAGATSFPGMPQDIFDALPAAFVDSELGPLPEGWSVTSLGEITTELRRGISPKYVEQGGVCVINQRCIRNRAINLAPARRHDVEKKSITGRQVQLFDILVNSTGVGTLGRCAQIYELKQETIVDSHVTIVRPNTERVDPYYFGINITGRESEIEALGHGSTGQTELRRDRLEAINVVIPNTNTQLLYGKLVDPLFSKIIASRATTRTLTALRDTLLPKLISGELRVPDAMLEVAHDA